MSLRGPISYLVLVFLCGWLAQFAGLRLGVYPITNGGLFHYIALGALLYVPALCAWIASALEKQKEITGGTYWPVSPWRVLGWALGLQVFYLAFMAVGALAGLSTFTWRMGTLVPQINDMLLTLNQPVMDPAVERGVLPLIMVLAGLPLQIVGGATVVAAFALGTEMGWRGYLLPRLQGLGRMQAHLITGVLWGIWFLPMLWYWLAQNPHLQTEYGSVHARFLVLAILVSVVLGEVWLQRRNMTLTAVVLGSVIAQQFNPVTDALFENVKRPWGGPMGLIALFFWVVLALAILFAGRTRPSEG